MIAQVTQAIQSSGNVRSLSPVDARLYLHQNGFKTEDCLDALEHPDPSVARRVMTEIVTNLNCPRDEILLNAALRSNRELIVFYALGAVNQLHHKAPYRQALQDVVARKSYSGNNISGWAQKILHVIPAPSAVTSASSTAPSTPKPQSEPVIENVRVAFNTQANNVPGDLGRMNKSQIYDAFEAYLRGLHADLDGRISVKGEVFADAGSLKAGQKITVMVPKANLSDIAMDHYNGRATDFPKIIPNANGTYNGDLAPRSPW